MVITISNCSVDKAQEINAVIPGFAFDEISARILKQDVRAYNTFDNPENVKVEDFNGVTKTADGISFTLPACSIAEIVLG